MIYCANNFTVIFLLEFCLQGVLPANGKTEIDEFDVVGVFIKEKKVLRL
jgi:hypothetical protein